MSLRALKALSLGLLISFCGLTNADTFYLGALHEVIYYEARGDGTESMVAVAQVVLNRVNHRKFPNSISEVRSQRKQFSYFNEVPFRRTMKEKDAAINALLIAVGVYSGIYRDQRFNNSIMYHVCEGKRKVKPRWHWWKLKFDGKAGTHCFYSYKE